MTDELTGEWKAIGATFHDDGIELDESYVQNCTITRTGEFSYRMLFKSTTSNEPPLDMEVRRRGNMLFGQMSESEVVEFTLTGDGTIQMRSQYDDRLLRRQ